MISVSSKEQGCEGIYKSVVSNENENTTEPLWYRKVNERVKFIHMSS
jgi:hypothetical protein